MPFLIGLHQAGDAEHGIGAECERVQIVVVDAPVDDIHALGAFGRAHVDVSVYHGEVVGFDQFHTHLLREQGMFVVGRIEYPGREDHHGGVGEIRQMAERVQEMARIVIDRPYAIGAEKFRKRPLHNLPGFQHIGDAGGASHVVFQDIIAAVADADEVDPRDMAPDAARGLEALTGSQKSLAGIDEFAWDDAVFEDLLLMVHIVDKEIERAETLPEPGFDMGPIRGFDDAWHDVEGKDLLVSVVAPVDTERHAHVEDDAFGGLLAFFQFPFGE